MTALDTGVLECAPSLRLIPLSAEHVEPLSRAASLDRSTFDLAPVPRDHAETQRYVASALSELAAYRAVPYVVEHEGAIVGAYRLMSLEWWTWRDGPVHVAGDPRVCPSDAPDVVEIGHAWLVPSVQRTAVNTRVALRLMEHAFDVWRVHRLVLKTDARNARSRGAIERLGGQLEGIVRAHSPAADGVIRDVALYSILPAEWPQVRARGAAARTRLEFGARSGDT